MACPVDQEKAIPEQAEWELGKLEMRNEDRVPNTVLGIRCNRETRKQLGTTA